MKILFLVLTFFMSQFAIAEQSFTITPGSTIELTDLDSPASITCKDASQANGCFCSRGYQTYVGDFYQVVLNRNGEKEALSKQFLEKNSGQKACQDLIRTLYACER